MESSSNPTYRTRKFSSILILLILISTFSISMGCLEEEAEEPEDVLMDVIDKVRDDEEAREGRDFLKLKVEMINEMEEQIELDRAWFELETRDLIYSNAFEEGMRNYLEPEETDEFWLIFEVHKDDEPTNLVFDPVYHEGPLAWTEI